MRKICKNMTAIALSVPILLILDTIKTECHVQVFKNTCFVLGYPRIQTLAGNSMSWCLFVVFLSPPDKLPDWYLKSGHYHLFPCLLHCTLSPCFVPIYFTPFCCNTPYQSTALLNLRCLIFCLTPFGWFIRVRIFLWGY